MEPHRAFLGAALLALAMGCTAATDPAGGGGPCTGSVQFQATGGPTPTFTWQPACFASGLVITSNPTQPGAGLAALVWSVSSMDDSNRIAPPVHYGVAPQGENSYPNPPAPLTAGSSYRLSLYARTTGGDLIVAFTILQP